MCLIVDNPNPQTSEENIFCYKVLKIEKIVDNEDRRLTYKRYVTPYQNFEPYFCEVLTAEGKLNPIPYYHGGVFCVDVGVFHSFETLEGANREAHKVMHILDGSFDAVAVVKCIIPARTLYYKGNYSGYTSYASKEIIFSEIIEETASQN